LKLFSNKNKEIYFLTKNGKISSESKINLILSPEFYWVRIFTIPVSMAKSAVKVLPSLFEDVLPNKHHDYYAIKIENHKFICFAYDNNEILTYIKKSGLNLTQINSVRFAQTEMKEYESFTIENTGYVYDSELLVKIPQAYLVDTVDLDHKLSGISLTSNKINIKFYINKISIKYVYQMLILLSLLILTNTTMYIIYESEINKTDSQINVIKEKDNIPKSSLRMNSIFNDMKEKSSHNEKLREIVFYVLKVTKETKNINVKQVSFLNNMVKVVFSNANVKEIKKHIEKKYKTSKSKQEKNSIEILVAI